MDEIASLYSKGQQGGDLPYFVGKQYGSGWFRNIARMVFPFLKRFGKVAVDTAQDVLSNKPILPSLKRHAIDAAKETLPAVAGMIANRFGGSKKKKRSINKARKGRTIFS